MAVGFSGPYPTKTVKDVRPLCNQDGLDFDFCHLLFVVSSVLKSSTAPEEKKSRRSLPGTQSGRLKVREGRYNHVLEVFRVREPQYLSISTLPETFTRSD